MDAKTAAMEVMRTLNHFGFKAFMVGGCVRDFLLGRTPKDIDVCTDAHPNIVQNLFPKTIPVGAQFGVVVVVVGDQQIEVATFRADGDYSDGRRPDTVAYSTSARADVTRRDFTINGLLQNEQGDTLDYIGGGKDIIGKVIRAIGDPVARFTEDKLRMLRAVRFAAQLGFTIEPTTFAAIKQLAPQITTVSRERIREELLKILTSPSPAVGLQLLKETGLRDVLFPGLRIRLDRFTPDWVTPVKDEVLALAMFLMDTPHEAFVQIMDSLKLSNETSDAVNHAIMCAGVFAQLGTGNLRRFMVKQLARKPGFMQGLELLEQNHQLMLVNTPPSVLTAFTDHARALTPEEINPKPLVTGDDLIAMGLKPSPAFKMILGEIEVRQLDGELADRETALALAKALAQGRPT